MRKEVIVVPWGECPLDVLARLGEQTENAWVFLYVDTVRVLEMTASSHDMGERETLKWDETNPLHPGTTMVLKRDSELWFRVIKIDAPNIAFKDESHDPENIFFFQIDIP